MPTRSQIGARLGTAISTGALLPLVRTGLVGERVAATAAALRAQLTEPLVLEPTGSARVMNMGPIIEVARAVIELSRAETGDRDIVVNLFAASPDPAVA